MNIISAGFTTYMYAPTCIESTKGCKFWLPMLTVWCDDDTNVFQLNTCDNLIDIKHVSMLSIHSLLFTTADILTGVFCRLKRLPWLHLESSLNRCPYVVVLTAI